MMARNRPFTAATCWHQVVALDRRLCSVETGLWSIVNNGEKTPTPLPDASASQLTWASKGGPYTGSGVDIRLQPREIKVRVAGRDSATVCTIRKRVTSSSALTLFFPIVSGGSGQAREAPRSLSICLVDTVTTICTSRTDCNSTLTSRLGLKLAKTGLDPTLATLYPLSYQPCRRS